MACPYCGANVQPMAGPSGPICPSCHNRGLVRPNADGAVASMVLGIVSFFISIFGVVTAIMAIVMGRKALRLIQESGGRLQGEGMAKAGFILGIIALVLAAVVVVSAIVFVFVARSASSNAP